ANAEIEDCGSDGKQNQRGKCYCTAPPQHGILRRSGNRFHLIGGGKEAPRDLNPGGFRLLRTDQSRREIALDLRKLISIDGEIAAGTGLSPVPRQRPKHRENGGGGHEREDQPECHAPLTSRATASRN